MTETLEPVIMSDEALLDLVRAGDTVAWAELFGRHHEAATRMARGIDPSNADDLVSEAFTRVYLAARKGAGVRTAFRAYLFQTIRNLAVNRFQRDRRLMWVDELPAEVDEGDGSEVGDRMTSETLANAFRSLPPRWQTVLWHTAVEGDDHQAVGRVMGLKPNAVAALSFRAREGLRRAYIDAHVAATDVAECREVRRLVPGRVLGKLSVREDEELSLHLDGCAACTAVVLEVVSVNGRPGTALLPAIVGPVLAAGYVGQGGAAGTLVDDPSPLFVGGGSHFGAIAAAGTTLVLLLGSVGLYLALQGDPSEDQPTTEVPASSRTTDTGPTALASSAATSTTLSPRGPVDTPPPSVSGPTSSVSVAEMPTAPASVSSGPRETRTTATSAPMTTTRHDLSIAGGAVTSYPDHQHVQLALGPESSGAGTIVTYVVPGLESFASHRRGEYRVAGCELTAPAEVTCTLGAGTGDVAIDVVVTGDLVVSATISAGDNIDPVPGNDVWRTP